MLKNNLYYIESLTPVDTGIIARLALVQEHPVFKGHFPGQPVLPGACMVQMVKELTEDFTGKKLFLSKAGNIKFLSFVDPTQDKHLSAELKISEAESHLSVNARFFNDETTFFKLTGTFDIFNISEPVSNKMV